MTRESCKHFTGTQRKVCKLGICYEDFKDKGLPCLPHYAGLHPNGAAACDKFEAPSKEELAAREAQFKKSIESVDIARRAIIADLQRRFTAGDKTVYPLNPRDEHRWHKPQDHYYSGGGVMECPVCKTGKLRYSRAGHNGHVHAKCSTEGCVAWME